MRWPGTIQPSRFLSHTGQVLPGVRRVVQVQNPAAGADWAVKVPGGVTWLVLSGSSVFSTSATVGNRSPASVVTVDGVTIWSDSAPATQAASKVENVPIVGVINLSTYPVTFAGPSLYVPLARLPEGSTIGSNTFGIDPGDTWNAVALWIEEVYVTDAQLSEDARLHAELERDIAIYEYEQAQQAGGNA